MRTINDLKALIAKYPEMANRKRAAELAAWVAEQDIKRLEREIGQMSEWPLTADGRQLPERFVSDGVLVEVDVDDGLVKLSRMETL